MKRYNIPNYYSSVDDIISSRIKTKKEYKPSKDYSNQEVYKKVETPCYKTLVVKRI